MSCENSDDCLVQGDCDDSQECNEHGDCIDSQCSCDLGWYGDNCSQPGKDLWKQEWDSFVTIFSIIYTVLFVFSTFKLYRAMNPDSFIGIRRLLLRIISSPKNLSLFCLALVGLLKLLWLLIDPFSFSDISSRVTDRLLYESVYPLYVCIYSSVLLVWGGLFQGMYSTRQGPYRYIKKFVVSLMIISSPLCWILSIIKGLRVYDHTWFNFSYVLLCIAIAILTFLYISFGIILCCYVEHHAKDLEGENLDQVQEYRSMDVFGLYKPPVKRNSSKMMRIRTDSIDQSYNDDSQNLLRIEEYDFSVEGPDRSWDSFVSEKQQQSIEMTLQDIILTKNIKKKQTTTNSHFILNINREDKFVFRKIIILAILAGLLGAAVLATFGTFMINGDQDHESVIQLLFISFSIQAFAAYLIFTVFTTQIKVEPKERLKFVQKIAMKKINHIPILKSRRKFRNITRRFKLYFS